MKVLQINCSYGMGSTGKICESISGVLFQNNVENVVCCVEATNKHLKSVYVYSNSLLISFNSLISHVFGIYGFVNVLETIRLIHFIKRFKPDVVHLHNLHAHNVNLKLLFGFLNRTEIKVVWTFHDCWAFTGYCPYFTLAKCDRWKRECRNCPTKKRYSFFFDFSKKLFHAKRNIFLKKDIVIITPSAWLKTITEQSFFRNSRIEVINNGIDLSSFYIEDNYKRSNKKGFIVLGVASIFDERKGLRFFNFLAEHLPNNYEIVVIGKIESKILLDERIVHFERTGSKEELRKYYNMADVFVNPTLEDNFPTTNIESLACGTPVVTFNTGGSPEIIDDTCGIAVDSNDLDGLLFNVENICSTKPFSPAACRKRAELFEEKKNFSKYYLLYKDLFS